MFRDKICRWRVAWKRKILYPPTGCLDEEQACLHGICSDETLVKPARTAFMKGN